MPSNPTERVTAVEHIRRMRGGAQAHLMRCSDGHFYVVKFRNNPQHCRVLANEMLATRLADAVGLPVPPVVIVEVDERLVENTPELCVQLVHHSVPCATGPQFGSRYAVNPLHGQVLDYIPTEMLTLVKNLETFLGILLLDKWMGNADGRQVAFWRLRRERKYHACFIDQGHCFNAGEWTFPDYPLRGIYSRNEVYESVHGWDSFEPWLARIENFDVDLIGQIANQIPQEWYGGARDELERLVRVLIVRRGVVRQLIESFRHSPRRPFPLWDQPVISKGRPAAQAIDPAHPLQFAG